MAMLSTGRAPALRPATSRTLLRTSLKPGRAFRPICASSNPAGTEKFDYIIVGGGAAGCVLANRLTADGSKRVLLLEAGPPGGAIETRLPAMLTKLFRNPVLDWNLHTKSQPQLGSREVYNARGKTVGGSSSTNATLYLRGSAQDFDGWGLEGWTSKDLLPWFIKSEDNPQKSDSPYHGTGGIMHVENPRYENPLHEEFFRSVDAIGFKANPDFNDWSHSQEGYGEFQVTQTRGLRADMFQQAIKPIEGRPNLKVVANSRTTKVVVETGANSKRAVGVEFAHNLSGREIFSAEVAAGGEVVLSAGSVGTPQVLLLSGLGPAAQLKQFGIPVVADLPLVGQNIRDHPAAVWTSKIKEEYADLAVTGQIYNKKNSYRTSAILNYAIRRRGPIATTGCDHGAFVSTTGSGEPDLQMRFVPAFSLDPNGIDAYVRFAELKAAGLNWPAGISVQMLNVRPKSVGSVGLKSADPFDLASLDTKYFTDPDNSDIATLVKGIRLCRDLVTKGPLGKYVSEEGYPGPGVQTDAELDAYVRKTVHSGNSLVGGCRMGTSSSTAVVSSTNIGAVFGVDGLRVLDASVLPGMPGAQTGAVTVMLAERAAVQMTSSVSKDAAPAAPVDSRVPVAA